MWPVSALQGKLRSSESSIVDVAAKSCGGPLPECFISN